MTQGCMKWQSLVAAVFSAVAITPLLRAQEASDPVFVGLHVGDNLSNFSDRPIDMARIGGQVLVPIRGPFSFYPAASIYLDGADWQLSALARIDPTPSRATIPLYLGGGVSIINWDDPTTRFYDVLFWGLKAQFGTFQAFVEMQFLDPIHRLTTTTRGNFGVQLYLGVNRAM